MHHRGPAPVPSQTTKAWLESLPRPPGATDCSPRSASDWQLAEQWRVLIEAIEILGRAQRWRIEASRRQWDGNRQSSRCLALGRLQTLC